MPRSQYPEGWTEQELESVAEIDPESLTSSTAPDYQFRYIDISSVDTGKIDWEAVTTQTVETAPSRAKRVVRPEDVLLSTVRPTLQSHAFADWPERDGYVCSTGFAVIRAGVNLEAGFLRHLVFSRLVTTQLRRFQTGSNYPAVPQDDVGKIRIPVPPVSEQRRIADILDAADEAIRQSERVIAKLREMKKGLLHDLLTRGLDAEGNLRDPEAHPEQFRDSPLGRIPREWKACRVKELGQVVTGTTPSTAQPDYYGGEIPFVSPADLNGSSHIYETEKTLTKEGAAHARLVPAGSVLVTCIGILGKVGEAMHEVAHNQQINSIVPYESLEPDFVFWAAHLLDTQMKTVAGLQVVPIVKKSLFSSLQLPCPPVDEQRRIAQVLDAHDTRIQAEEAALNKLRQVKRGLMDDLLTGWVRV